jgi:hypothetical protein
MVKSKFDKSGEVKRRASLTQLDSAVITGYLEKKSTGVQKKWQKRFFSIEGNFLK